nr:stigma-specific STIG1-like protein 1 [Ipomoea batatas]
MKILKALLFLAIIISVSSAQPPSTKTSAAAGEPLFSFDDGRKAAETPTTSLRGIGHFLAQKGKEKKAEKTRNQTCNKNPRICRAKGSPGPDCCKKKCVNVMSDRQNCGVCGKKCTYDETCCRGKCVSVLFDKNNCGGCRKKCKKGTTCVYGMCTILMSIAITTLSSTQHKDEEEEEAAGDGGLLNAAEPPQFLRGTGRILAQKGKEKKVEKARNLTCNKNPRICRAKGSPGPDCCKKKCVDVMNDRQNCGLCGKKCRYNETCCRGKCVSTLFDKNNCGGCRKKCKKGTTCVYGMCSYA